MTVELPLDDAATKYAESAKRLAALVVPDDYADLEGATADMLREIKDGFNAFIAQTAHVLAEQAEYARAQHAADEDLRDTSRPVAEIEQKEAEARKLNELYTQLSASGAMSIFGGDNLKAKRDAAQAEAEAWRAARNSALQRHTEAAQRHKPLLRMQAPPLELPTSVFGSLGCGSGQRSSRTASPQNGSGGSGSAYPSSASASTAGPGGGASDISSSSRSGGSVDDSSVGTETSADALGGAGIAPQPMMQQPMTPQTQGAQSPYPYGAGSIAPGGMLTSDPNAAGRYDPRKSKRNKRSPSTELTSGAGLGGALAATFGPGGAVDRGISVSGVNTKADTSGAGSTQLSGANGQKPGDGGRGPGGMMRGGMMPMGPMGSGAQGGPSAKPRGGDGGIKPIIPDRELTGADSIRSGVEAGLIGRETAREPDELGFDRFLDPERLKDDIEKQRKDKEQWS